VLAVLPYGKGTVTVVEGGLEVRNDAGTDSTLIANACAIVRLASPEGGFDAADTQDDPRHPGAGLRQ